MSEETWGIIVCLVLAVPLSAYILATLASLIFGRKRKDK